MTSLPEVWCISLAKCDPVDLRQRFSHWMTASERTRHAQIQTATTAFQFLVGRILARGVLAQFLSCPPDAVPITFDRHNRPQLAGHTLDFNLSHSQNSVCLAVGRDTVGVDIECTSALRHGCNADLFGVGSALSTAETTYIRALPAKLRKPATLRIWTLKEAIVKHDGRGLSIDLQTIDLCAAALVCKPHLRLFQTFMSDGGSVSLAYRAPCFAPKLHMLDAPASPPRSSTTLPRITLPLMHDPLHASRHRTAS